MTSYTDKCSSTACGVLELKGGHASREATPEGPHYTTHKHAKQSERL